MTLTITLVTLATVIAHTHSFYIYLTTEHPQCFYNNIYKDQRLLAEIETPIVSLMHKIVMTVTNDNNTLLEKDIVNQAKFTIPRPTNIITNQPTIQNMQYQTCFKIIQDPTTPQPNPQNPTIPRKGYLLNIKLFTNFQHKLQQNKDKQNSTTSLNYKQLIKISNRLKEINNEQITLHQINEVKQKLSQFYLENLKEKVIIYSVLEIAIVLLFTLMQIRMLKGYLSNLSVI